MLGLPLPKPAAIPSRSTRELRTARTLEVTDPREMPLVSGAVSSKLGGMGGDRRSEPSAGSPAHNHSSETRELRRVGAGC